MNTRRRERGFTLVEVGVILPMLILTALALFTVVFFLIQSSTHARTDIDLAYDNQQAIKSIETDSTLTSTFLATPESTVTDPYPPVAGTPWNYKGTSATNRVLVIQAFSTDAHPLASSRKPIYVGNSAGTECNATNIYFNNIQHYNLVYFVKNGDLFRRKLINSSIATCTAQFQKLSCPSVEDLAAQGIMTRNSSCSADDELLARGVSEFSVAYYATPTTTTALDVYATGANPDLVRTANAAEITLRLDQTSYGKVLSNTSKLRFTKLNISGL